MPPRTPTRPTSSTASHQSIQTSLECLSSKVDTKFAHLNDKVDGNLEIVKAEITASEKKLEVLIMEQVKKINDKIDSLEHPDSIMDDV